MFITIDIIAADWVTKKQFYKSIGMQDFTTGDIVPVRQRAGEYSEDELLLVKTELQTQMDEVDAKLTYFAA